MVKVSDFGKKIAAQSGIGHLMDDLGSALTESQDVLMLGGGNPAHIPQVEKQFRESILRLLKSKKEFERVIGNYDPPQGNKEFIAAMCTLLRGELGWDIGPKNIALTNGSQSAFFILFNIFAGTFEGQASKKILLPLAPEYIGYCDVGLSDDLFLSHKPEIKHLSDRIFKYHVNFHKTHVTDEIGAICVSRPTNPTGNVLTDAEIGRLGKLARSNNIPLIIDNAYGAPFPNIVFAEAKPAWDQNTVVCMSLSKLGLPGTRTGIVIANEEIIAMVSQVNAVISLAPGGVGPAIATNLVRSGQILRLSQNVIKPFYQTKATQAVEVLCQELNWTDFHIHKPEGAFFLWLWLPGLPITDGELYKRLKKRGVLVVPGHYFFPGLKEQWQHKHQCIRINYSQGENIVTRGLKIMADEIKRTYDAGK